MDFVWTRTILLSFNSLEVTAAAIDMLVRNKAINTHSFCFDRPYETTYNQLTELIALIDKKSRLINLKLITETAIEKLDLRSAQILSLRYFEQKTPEEIVKLLYVSMRTYYRCLHSAIEKFSRTLLSMGYGDDWFQKDYFDQSWLKNKYLAVKKSGCDDDFIASRQKCAGSLATANRNR